MKHRLGIVCILLVIAASAWWGPVQAQGPEVLFILGGGEGSALTQFSYPRALALAPDGSVYVADSENHRVQAFTADGVFLWVWGSYGSEPGQFDVPQGIAVGSDGSVYVADRNNSRIQKFTAHGDFVTAWGSPGSELGQFVEPRNLTVDVQGRVYVADSQNNRIQVFSAEGDFIRMWGTAGDGPGAFNYATGVAVGPDGTVYVCDAENHRMQMFDPDGTFLDMWGSQGGGPGEFDRPYSATVDAAGRVYVVDEWNHRIQVFTAQGDFITQWGELGTGWGQFQYPHGVVAGEAGVYVVDEWNHRVQVFAPLDDAAPVPPVPAPPGDTSPDTPPTAVPAATFDPDTAPPESSGEVLYAEDFQDNAADGWTVGEQWLIMQAPDGNYVLYSVGPGRADLDGVWGDVQLDFRMQITSGTLIVTHRSLGDGSIVGVRFSAAEVTLFRRPQPDAAAEILAIHEEALPAGTALDVTITSSTGQIQVWIAGRRWIDYTGDAVPALGPLGFARPAGDMGDIWIDDVTIRAAP